VHSNAIFFQLCGRIIPFLFILILIIGFNLSVNPHYLVSINFDDVIYGGNSESHEDEAYVVGVHCLLGHSGLYQKTLQTFAILGNCCSFTTV